MHSVDASTNWIENTKKITPNHLLRSCHHHHASVSVGTFHDRLCHFYNSIPNIIPDLIYLDGPDPLDVEGEIANVTWQNPDRCVMAGDILRIESQLLPGTVIIVDGRVANARFIAAHLYRNWDVQYNPSNDVTVMELQEKPLGKINLETLLYMHGARIHEWK